MSSLAKKTTDCISFLAHVNTELNLRRHELLRPALNTQYQQLCSPQAPMSTQLFGDNLAETVKTLATTNKVSNQLPSGGYHGHRSDRPVTHGSRGQPASRRYTGPGYGRGKSFLGRGQSNFKKRRFRMDRKH